MSGRRPRVPPALVGLFAVVVVVAAVVLAFRANTSLPLVPRYDLDVQVANAEELTHGSEVHMGGSLIGTVSAVKPARSSSGRAVAVLDLALDKSVEPLPIDSHFTIRIKGSIGEKYLDVTLGHAHRSWPAGAMVPVRDTSAGVDIDQVLSMFTAPTRQGVRRSTEGLATALAGRGSDLNGAIAALVPLITRLTPVMRNLAADRTDLGGFIAGLGKLASTLAPVAGRQAQLVRNLDVTFRALAGVARPYLQTAISEAAPTFQQVVRDGPTIGSFATDAAQLFTALRPDVELLGANGPALTAALQTGSRTLPATAVLDRRVASLSRALAGFAANPSVRSGLTRLTQTAAELKRPLQYLAPVQTSCNYVTLMLRNLSSSLSDPSGTGTVLRVLLVVVQDVKGDEAVPSSRPFTQVGTIGSGQYGPLHSNPYPYTASPGQPRACAAGNEQYSAASAQIGDPKGKLSDKTESTATSTTASTTTTPSAG
jgi:ABC-type transporter Mla subunit MlaD